MDKQPLITIITPTYNREELLEKAILSIVNQKKDIPFDREMLICDDGSTDNTKELISRFIEKYPHNIKYLWQEDKGNRVGRARNMGLNNMSKNSDYVTFLDSDDELVPDCIYTCLHKRNKLKKDGLYKKISGIAYFCKDQHGVIVGSKKIFKGGVNEVPFTYQLYLKNTINWEIHAIRKSSDFIENSFFRFPEKFTSESVLWSNIREYLYKQNKELLLLNYEGRIYRIEKNSDQITKSIDTQRFKKNALGNTQILDILGPNLIKFGYHKQYANILFKIGINRILYGEKRKGLLYIKKSLSMKFNLKILFVFLACIIHRRIVLFLYKLYIN